MKRQKNLFIIFIAIAILAPLLLPLIQSGTLHQFDTILHLERIVAFYRALADHNFPPTWSTYLSYGFGSPVLIYNWSFPYYIASVFLLLGSTLVDTYKWMTALTYILAFLFMFTWIASLTASKIAALVAATWYVWAPYRFNINQLRGAIGEEFATALWPGVFWSTTMIFRKRYTLGFFIGTVCWSLMVWSHPPMFAMILPLWIIYTTILLLHTRNIRAAWASLGTVLVGMGMVAFSWAPILFERGFLYYGIHEAIYPDNFVRWTQLLAQPDFYEFHLQLWGTRYLVFYSIGWMLIAAAFLTLWHLATLRRKWTLINWNQAFVLLMGVFGVFLMRPASTYLWAHLPLLAPTMVYPQRFLGLVMFCGSVLGGLYISHVHKRHTLTAAFIAITCIMFFNYPYLTLNKDREPNLDRLNHPVLTTTDVWGEFSPIWAPSDFGEHGPEYGKQPLITPQYPCTQTSTSITCQTKTVAPQTIRIRQFYFPGWYAFADGKKIPIAKNADGTMSVYLAKPTQTVRIEFTDTPLRFYSKLLSIITILCYILVIARNLERSRKRRSNLVH